MIRLIDVAQAGVISEAPRVSNIGMNILYFLLSVVGIIAIISLVVSAMMYVTSVGDEKRMRKVKKNVQYAFLGIVMALGGMVLVRLIGQFFQAQ
ncbi:MAG: hypothetical protein ACD_56C00039G0004 [uncultured bacterium]|nr:MAG: hypothetical protein ACD_56C00039G0004 [uncultured bacterium]